MSDSVQLDQVAMSPGVLLKTAREASNLPEREVADRLNWLPRYVQTIEADDYSVWRSTTFARGYVKAYGRLLGVDEAELMESFDGLDNTITGGAARRVTTQPLQLQRTGVGMIIGLVALGLLAAGLWWWQTGFTGG
ncbi:MAG: helix-turn-helix domain-containing protein [Halioglobus sp.]